MAVCLLIASGCEVRGVSLDPSQPVPETDVGPDDDLDLAGNDCTAGQSTCEEGTRKVCNEDGEVEQRDCEAGTICQAGECIPIETQCPEEDQQDSFESAFSLSHPDQLTFDVDHDEPANGGPAPETRSLEIENCSEELLHVGGRLRKDANPFGDNPGTSAFELLGEPEVYRELPPGQTVAFEVAYQPQHTLSHEPGALELDILGRESRHRASVELKPRVLCATATPELTMNEFARTRNKGIFLQNCGTETIQPSSSDIVPVDQASLSAVEVTSLESNPTPLVLHPGEHRRIPLRIEPRAGGPFTYRVEHGVGAQLGELTTEISGYATSERCRDGTLDPPEVYTKTDDGDREPSSEEGWEHQVRSGERLEFELPPYVDDEGTYLAQLEAPNGSRAELDRAHLSAGQGGINSFRTDVAGSYRVTLNHADADHRPLCDPPVLEIEARPEADLYVDLAWDSRAGEVIDPIESDVGYNQGVDLNLHMAATDDLEEDTSVAWTDWIDGCFGLGIYPDEADSGGMAGAERAGCRSTRGLIDSLSVSGAHREIMRVEEADQRYYHLGVMVWSMYEYSNVKLDLRVLSDGEAVEDFEFRDEWWGEYDNPPRDPMDMLTFDFDTVLQVWRFGVWDAELNRLLPYPRARFDTQFPSSP